MTIAGRWLRVSTAGQDEASQEPDVDRWIQQHGYEAGPTYQVHGQSAYHGKHEPELRQAMADMAAGKIGVLVVWKSDRIERRGAFALMGLIREAIEAGGRIEFATEPGLNNASDPIAGPMLQAFYGAVAHHESQTKSDRVKAKQAALRAAGSFSSGKAPYGYAIEAQDGRKTLVPSDAAPAVRRIFRMAASGTTLLDIARALTADGVPTFEGKAVWSEGTISQIIGNVAYRGLVQYHGVTYLKVEPLVSAADWLKANQVVKARAQSRGHGSRGRPSKTFLRPACGRCGGPMYRYRRSYRCAGLGPSGNSSQRHGCGNTIPLEVLNAEVWQEFAEADGPEIVETVVPGKDYAEEIAAIQLAIRDLDALADDYDERHAALVTELRRLRSLPAEPGHRTAIATGRSEGDAFRAMTDEAEQRAFIRLWTLTVWPKDCDDPRALATALMGRRWTLTRKPGQTAGQAVYLRKA